MRSARAGDLAAPHSTTRDAARLVRLGHDDAAHELLDRALQLGSHTRAVLRFRRRLAGYVGAVAPEILARAALSVAPGATIGATQVLSRGRGADVDVVVRHHLTGGHSMIRKTLHGLTPIEVLAYQSGLIEAGGRWWRAPRLYALERDGPVTWHMFFEDLGEIHRLRSPTEAVAAARALGELNAAYLRDPTLASRFPWLVRPPSSRRPFVLPGFASRRLAGAVDPALAKRVRWTLRRLDARSDRLVRLWDALPVTLCHGGANTANVVMHDGGIVLMDWSTCRLAPIGSDLASLLGRSSAAVRERPSVVRECLDAYAEAMAATVGSAPKLRRIERGYRYQLTAQSFRNVFKHLPVPPGVDEGARSRRPLTPELRRRLEAHLERLCDESDAMLRQSIPKHRGGRSRREPESGSS